MIKPVILLCTALCLVGCEKTPEEKTEYLKREQNKDATFSVKFRCIDGYLFIQKEGFREYSISQFWEIGQNGQPLPRVCGGNNADRK